ncbi:MAG: 2-oxoglutarate and iron-dependent oxygenase domain-containing protein [Myxococcota bacterium]
MDTIPVVDLDEIKRGDFSSAAEALRVGLGEYGLIYIQNHGVEKERLERLYDALVALTKRPEEEKRSWSGTDIWYQRGWTPPNTEQAVVAGGQPDFKECYFVAPIAVDPRAKLMFPEMCADNRWPDGADSFREDYLALGTKVHEVGLALLEACAIALDLPRDAFTRRAQGAAHVTRALRYLALTESQVGTEVLWGEEHTDFNLLTLLPGGRFYDPSDVRCAKPDAESGLYLRTRPSAEHPKGRMVQGVPPTGCIVAQVGQQLEVLTGGTYLATPHVITPPAAAGYTRTALAHFVHVHPEEKLFPLDPFLTDNTIRAYGPPVLAGTYGLKTLVDIGLAPKSALEKLGYRHYERLEEARG